MDYEYRVIPAPKRLKKVKGISSAGELFAATLAEAINAEAREGWEYVRSESLAAEQPGGFLRRGSVVEETMMIFRRPRRGETAREPALREVSHGEPRLHEPVIEARGPSGSRAPAGPERSRPLTGLSPRSDAPRAEAPEPKPRPGSEAPPLLRPVPRHKPGEKP